MKERTMENENTKKTTSGEAEEKKTGTPFPACGPSCCGSMEMPGMDKMENCCKGLPDPREMYKMMEVCFCKEKEKE
jgi:hypothetical protein